MNEPTRRRCFLLVALAIGANPCAAYAAGTLVPVVWNEQGRFEAAFDVAPGRFVELCGALPAGGRVAWTFRSPAPLDFNIHYHVGKDVRFPAQRDGVAELEGVLEAAVDQDYCWMWTHKGSAPAPLRVLLRRLSS